jgi:acyl-CoA dehydrogenase
MNFELCDEHRMLKELVTRFVADELVPLEPMVLAAEASGVGTQFPDDVRARLNARAKELGLYGLDAPEEFGGMDLPAVALVGVEEELGKSVAQYILPPDSPNLRMLQQTVDERQREA